jgi:Ran GTPase-activating protein (RanGAP) involved in mRNA processing and transport
VQELDISTNRITFADFGEELHTVPALCHLDISVNPLGDSGARRVIKQLPAAPNLAAINLRLTGVGAEGVAELVKQLPGMANLRVLNLAANRIDPSTVSTLAKGLAAAAALEALELGGNAVDHVAMVQLAAATASSPCLAKINMSHVSVDVRRDASVPEFTQPFPESLRWLNMSIRASRTGAGALFTTRTCNELRLLGLSFERLAAVEMLDVSGCVVEQEPFTNVLMNLTAIKDLNISRMKVTDIDIGLAGTLGRLTSLTALRAICSCKQTPVDLFEGALAAPTHSWLPAFRPLTALRHLNLSLRMCEHEVNVNTLTNLTFLDLSGNRLNADGCVALSRAFSKLQSLQHLGLRQTGCRDVDLRRMLLLAVELKSLTHLDISDTKHTTDGLGDIDSLGQSLAQLTALQVLVWHNAPNDQLVQLGAHLAPLTCLSKIDLEETEMGTFVRQADLLWLHPLSRSLKALNLKDTQVLCGKDIHQTETQQVYPHCALHLSALTALEELNLCSNMYRDRPGRKEKSVLYVIVSQLRQLRILKLRNMGLSPEAFEQLAPALGHLAHLSSLDLGRNSALGTLSMRLLARHLSGTLGLAKLLLDNIPLACSLSVSNSEDNVVRRALGRCTCKVCDRKDLPRLAWDDVPQLPGVGRGFSGYALRGH